MKRAKRRNTHTKLLALSLALALLLCGAIGGTLAWLTDQTPEVKNTFTTSDINITLQEHEYDPAKDALTGTVTTTGVSNYKMVPGWTIPKDPKATVLAGSEDCYLFVEIEESANFDSFMEYEIVDGWTKGDGNGVPVNVIYRRVSNSDQDQVFEILKNNKVTVKETVTKDMMDTLTNETLPTLTFKAYAVQQHNSNISTFTAATAWKTIHTPTAAPGLGIG